jgi:hypothetical protein
MNIISKRLCLDPADYTNTFQQYPKLEQRNLLYRTKFTPS